MTLKILILSFFVISGTVLAAQAQPNSIPGEISSPYPTLENLALEWLIRGDDNQNGLVRVEFREKGSSIWQKAMPVQKIMSEPCSI